MGDPKVREQRSKSRKRNFLVKKLREDRQFRKKIHLDKKQYEKSRRVDKKELKENAYREGWEE